MREEILNRTRVTRKRYGIGPVLAGVLMRVASGDSTSIGILFWMHLHGLPITKKTLNMVITRIITTWDDVNSICRRYAELSVIRPDWLPCDRALIASMTAQSRSIACCGADLKQSIAVAKAIEEAAIMGIRLDAWKIIGCRVRVSYPGMGTNA